MATIYAVGIYDPDEGEKNPGFLRRITHTSGGHAYFPETPGDVKAACTTIARDIRSRYTTGYTPPPAANNRAALRHISVRLTGIGRADLSAQTRTSYRYDEA